MLTVAAVRPVVVRPGRARSKATASVSRANHLLGARRVVRVRSSVHDEPPPAAAVTPISVTVGYASLTKTLGAIRSLPPSERGEAAELATKDVSLILNGMKASGGTSLWDCYPALTRRNIFPNELAQMGVKDASSIGRPSDTNDFNFIVGVTLSTSLLALIVGVTLPGDWGAFGSYIIGGSSLVVLAIGSTAPGLLKVGIDKVARINPEYRNRIAKHEAAHFLVGYVLGLSPNPADCSALLLLLFTHTHYEVHPYSRLKTDTFLLQSRYMLGAPVAGYSLGLGTAHVDFLEAKLERKVYGQIAIKEETMLPLACISMAGVAAEAMAFDEVQGQEGDLRDLQRILNKTEPKMSDQAQQQVTRWAVWQAASMLKKHEKAFDALTEKMSQGATVAECLQAIEAAPEP
jgi:hypothetical protein